MAEYRGRVELLGVLLGVSVKNKNKYPLCIKACSLLLEYSHRTKYDSKQNQSISKTRKLSGLAGFLLFNEVQRNTVTLDKFYSNFRR
jgi:hypothetical protein